MGRIGFKRNFLILLGDRSLTDMLTFLHLLYIWDSEAVFVIVVGDVINRQKQIIFEEFFVDSSLQPAKVST